MAMKKFRNMKVYEQSGYQYKSTPAIMLKGQWLREAGFDCGTSITVTCEEGRLVIVPREEASYVDAFEENAAGQRRIRLRKRKDGIDDGQDLRYRITERRGGENHLHPEPCIRTAETGEKSAGCRF